MSSPARPRFERQPASESAGLRGSRTWLPSPCTSHRRARPPAPGAGAGCRVRPDPQSRNVPQKGTHLALHLCPHTLARTLDRTKNQPAPGRKTRRVSRKKRAPSSRCAAREQNIAPTAASAKGNDRTRPTKPARGLQGNLAAGSCHEALCLRKAPTFRGKGREPGRSEPAGSRRHSSAPISPVPAPTSSTTSLGRPAGWAANAAANRAASAAATSAEAAGGNPARLSKNAPGDRRKRRGAERSVAVRSSWRWCPTRSRRRRSNRG